MQFSFAKVSPAGALVSIPLGEHADTSVKRTAAGSAGECLVHRHRVMGATVGYAVGHQMAKSNPKSKLLRSARAHRLKMTPEWQRQSWQIPKTVNP